MKTVAVTGAGGFIGRRLTRYLCQKGIRVLALDIPACEDVCVSDGAILNSWICRMPKG